MSIARDLKLNPGRLQTAYDLLQDAVARGDLPVGLLAVADARDEVRCEAYGPEGRIGTDSIYLIASITKPIVATALMQLVERGRVLIEDPVVEYVPEFGVQGKERVTVWHLLTHTSGMADDYVAQVEGPATAEKDLLGACGTSLRFPPGSSFEYCNPSFRIVGEIISRASGMTYQQYLRDNVFGPAGMIDTSFDPGSQKRSRVVPVPDFPPVPGGMEAFVATALPAGGLFSTASDLIAFGQGFLDGGVGKRDRLLSPVTVREMTRLHTEGVSKTGDGEAVPAFWGLSWEKAVPWETRLLSPSGFGHGGLTGTYLWIEPEWGIVVVFLTNRVGMERRVRKRIVNAVLAALE